MAAIDVAVAAAGRHECMGLLGREPGQHAVEVAVSLDATAGPGCAQADAAAIHEAVQVLLGAGLVPAGLWHSHGPHRAYESATDAETFLRLAPSFAAHDYRRPEPESLAPAVRGRAEAELPGADGWSQQFRLVGSPAPGLGSRRGVAWASVDVTFDAGRREPAAALEPRALTLAGAGVVLRLGLPEAAVVETARRDRSACRWARTFSLIVNALGPCAATSAAVVDIGGRAVVGATETCAVAVEWPGAAGSRKAWL